MSHAFFVGFLTDRPFYSRLALHFLDQAEKDAADPHTVKLARGSAAETTRGNEESK